MENYSVMDTVWILMSTVLVFIMQAGFMLLETGLTRKKNLANVAIENLMDFACGGIAFLLVGYRLMYGKGSVPYFPKTAFMAFTMMFCATAATIVSGAVVGRVKFKAYLIFTVCVSAIIYPIAGHWVWGQGWLSSLSIGEFTGFTDFAGGAVVHTCG